MRILFAILSYFFCSTSFAADFCEEENLVMDAQFEWDFAAGFDQEIPLLTHRGGQLYPTRVLLNLSKDGGDELQGSFLFPRLPNEVGLAYNIYRMQIQVGLNEDQDRQLIDQDYTDSCNSSGIALWPGQHLNLNPIKIQPHSGGLPRNKEKVHLRF